MVFEAVFELLNEERAIVQTPLCFSRHDTLKHVFVDPERSGSKFYLSDLRPRDVEVKW